VLERHEGVFGQTPEVPAADVGFCPDEEKYEELQGRVGTLAIPRRLRDLANAVLSMGRSFRSGIEGTISGLKRAFRLARCHYRGLKRFAAKGSGRRSAPRVAADGPNVLWRPIRP